MTTAADIIADVLIVDDHPLLRSGLEQIMALRPQLRLVGTAGTGELALQEAERLEPDLILLDLNLPDMHGLKVLQSLRASGSDARVVIFTVSDDQGDIAAAMRMGADGYLLKDTEPEDLIAALDSAVRGQTTLSPRVRDYVLERVPVDDVSRQMENLTPRERAVLELIAQGLSNKLIAQELEIAEGTVKVHVKRLLAKLGMRSRVEAALWLARHVGY
ncbi:MAG: two-component system response regulator NarL [Natronospirillum sp.]|uniref:two-component system response regulator NarL n=1 Tax=Natronospirillum sp. TaxID=2812955 RepID=UPI0025CF30B5|nr:two-component system response regulator NarL [Natronospirillum sp.]MCH8550722.1 two-component system response regulator NarL [Natronospirillum sp.]